MARKSSHLQIRVTPADKAAIRRGAKRAGLDVSRYVLARVQPPSGVRMAALVNRLGSQAAPDRYTLAELHDVLAALTSGELEDATGDLDVRGLSPLLQNYVAAMVEQASVRMGAAPPAWVHAIEPLDRPHFAAPFPRLRAHLLRVSPLVFKRRNIFVDATIGDRV